MKEIILMQDRLRWPILPFGGDIWCGRCGFGPCRPHWDETGRVDYPMFWVHHRGHTARWRWRGTHPCRCGSAQVPAGRRYFGWDVCRRCENWIPLA